MIRKKVFLIILICLFTAAQFISAEAPASLGKALAEFRQLVLEHNQSMVVLERQITNLDGLVSEVFHLENSTLSLSGGYAYNTQPGDLHKFTGSTSLTIPVLDQLSFSTQLNSAGNGSVSVNINPLAGIPEDITQEQQLTLLQLQQQSLERQLGFQSTIAVLNYVKAKQELDISQSLLDVARREYAYKQQQFDAGLLSLAELQFAANAFSSESIQGIHALQNEAGQRQDLLVLLSAVPVPDSVLNLSFNLQELEGLIVGIEEFFNQIQAVNQFSSYQEQSLLIQKNYLEIELENTWLMEPQFSLSGAYSVSDLFGTPTFTPTANVGVTLQIKVSDFNFEERDDIQTRLADLEQSLVLELYSLQVAQQAQTGALEIAIMSKEMAERNAGFVETAAEMAAYDYEKDNINQFAFEKAQLNKKSAEINLFSALISVYSQFSSLIQSYSHTGAQK